MLEFKGKVMLIRIRTEADLFDDRLTTFGFELLLTLLLIVEKLLVIRDLAYGRICLRTDLDEV